MPRWLPFILPGIYLALVAVGAELSDGAWAIEHLQPNNPVVFAVAMLMGALGFVLWFENTNDWLRPWPGKGPAIIALLLAILGPFALYFFRMRLFLPPPEGLGDSLLLLEHVPAYSRLLGYLDSFDELLELYLHSRFYLFGNDHFGWSIEKAYALLSVLAFAPYAFLWFAFLRHRPRATIWISLPFVIVPALQLFAGYVENYTLTTVWQFATLVLLTRIAERRRTTGLIWYGIMGSVWAIAILHHLVAATIAPGIGLLFLIRSWRAEDRIKEAFLPATVFVIALAATLALVWSYFFFLAQPPLTFADTHAANPPVLRPLEIIEPGHLWNIANVMWMMSPILPAILAAAVLLIPRHHLRRYIPWKSRWKWIARTDSQAVLLAAFLGNLAFTFVMNPIIGFPADWDVLGFPHIALNLFLILRLSDLLHIRKARPAIIKLCVIATFGACVWTGSWIARNHEYTEASQKNLERARSNLTVFLDRMEADPTWQRLSLEFPERRKRYIQVRFFFLRSRYQINEFSPDVRDVFAAKLDAADESFQDWILKPPREYESDHRVVWKKLGDLNNEIQRAGQE